MGAGLYLNGVNPVKASEDVETSERLNFRMLTSETGASTLLGRIGGTGGSHLASGCHAETACLRDFGSLECGKKGNYDAPNFGAIRIGIWGERE